MASKIKSTDIDENYPKAGVDNGTQGFRDNFSFIKTGLQTANSEITSLQNNTAKLDSDNDFGGVVLGNSTLHKTTFQYTNTGSHVSGSNISFLNGHYQTIGVNLNGNETPGTATFNLSDWPERNGLAKITVEFKGTQPEGEDSVDHEVLITSEPVSLEAVKIKYSSNFPNKILVNSVRNRENPIIIEFWTANGGQTVYANYLGEFSSD